MESAFLQTMSIEKLLKEGWSEEYRILINVLRDKLEEGEITIQEYRSISFNWRLKELRQRLEEEINSIKSVNREESLDVPDLYKYGVLEYKKSEAADKFKDAVIDEELEKIMCPEFVKYGVLEYNKSEGADDVKDAVIHGEVEKIMCSEFEVQMENGHVKTAGIIWTMGKVLTGSVFDGGGYCCWTNRQERAL